ncbi:gluconate:proton symporter [Leuconostoc mesenteroides subsp. mesenteroides]|uniref:gluconate:proton symporter n=1 Tax=Leuconostoc mesenteroides TaxID=1245 RepID=UPI000A04995B|nr:gluconate:proton symporter [Leuconostoc mesenteroides]ARN62983.1 gluconate:proton symporter [Leuconostoc mesenteroides subsp. mesenteroides]MDV8927160.1 gluconate:proton symporter [Leuconostoc mesenteroides]ORI90036.1 gluconate:proton symporter [Leuconostoc mesenteroides subsp. mesenteroides]ORI93590.1 gluconate:proton symporter [Leuconostoc mesenteroides subsp. mesenteroides]
MTNIIISILLLLTFVGFIYYIVKGGNLVIGFFVMALLWSVIGLVPFDQVVQKVIAEPALNYGPTIIYIVFGSWFGRVLVDSGIAGSISAQTERVGRKAPIFATILVVLVTALIFSSAYGIGSVIAIGVILIPILLSIGVPKKVAIPAFTMAIGAPMYINVVLFNQIKAFFPSVSFSGKYLIFGLAAMGVQLLGVIIFILLNSKSIKNGEIETIDDSKQATFQKTHPITFIIPVLPVALNMFFHWDAIPALLLATIIALLLTGQMKSYKGLVAFINKTVSQAINDISGLIIFLMALVMFAGAATMNVPHFKSMIEVILPSSPLVLAIAIGILAPLALFRGPLHVWGAGAATAAVLAATGTFQPIFLLPLLYTASIMAVSIDLTQSWNTWALTYSKLETKEYLKMGIPVMWVVSFVNELLVYGFFGH